MERNGYFLVSGAYFAGLLLSGWAWGWLGLGLVTLVGALASLRVYALPSWRFWVAAFVFAVGAGAYLHLRTPRPAPTDVSWTAPRSSVVFTGTVSGSVRLGPAGQRFLFTLDLPESGTVWVRAPGRPAVRPGERVHISGALRRPAVSANPNSFDERAYLSRQGAFAVLKAEALAVLGAPAPDWLALARERIAATHKRFLGEEAGALLGALVVGADAVTLPKAVEERYRAVGLAHLLAASGAQVSILLGAALVLLRGYPRPVQAAVGGILLAGFVALAGGGPSILRAAAMGAVALLAIVLGEKAEPLGALWAAAFVLLVADPLMIWDLGFAFSFLATLGLVVSVPKLAARLEGLPGTIAAALAVGFAATLWTLPLQLLIFGQWSPYALALNLLAAPVVEVLTLGGMAASALALVHPEAAGVVDIPLGWLLTALDALVRQVVDWPGSLATPGLLLPVQAVALYALLIAAHIHLSWRPLTLAAALVLVAPGWLPRPAATLAVLSSGSSEALVIETRRRTLVLGGGSVGAVVGVLVPYLEARGRLAVDAVVATGEAPRQTGGLRELLDAAEVEKLYDGVPPPRSAHWRQTLARLGTTRHIPLLAGERIELEDTVELRLLASEPPALLLEAAGSTLLLAGSPSLLEQRWLLQEHRGTLGRVQWLWSGGRLPEVLLRLDRLRGVLVSGRERGRPPARLPHWSTERYGGLVWEAWPGGARVSANR
jgi:competence protein ComEC